MANNKITIRNQYLLFHYILENNSSELQEFYFEDGAIKSCVKAFNEFVKINGSKPSIDSLIDIICENDFTLEKKHIKTILSNESYKNEIGSCKSNIEGIKAFIDEKQKTLSNVEKLRDMTTWLNEFNKRVEVDEDDVDILTKTPSISNNVYSKLPDLLKEMTDSFNDYRVKDMFFTSLLATTSSIFPSVYGVYYDNEVNSNLFSFISASAGSGKSSVKFSRDVLLKTEQSFQSMIFDPTSGSTAPATMKEKLLVIPGDTSSAALVNKLNDNGGVGLIFETEADVLSNAKKNDWGDSSTIYRKAFHHEDITKQRVDRIDIVKRPKISVSITGTLEQVFTFINNSEDGLVSRFLFYVYKDQQKWISPRPTGKNSNKTRLFYGDFSDRLHQVYDFYKNKEVEFTLTDKQWDIFDNFFVEELEKSIIDDSSDALVKRGGLIAYRIMMLLTIFRNFQETDIFGSVDGIITCDNIDFNTALELIAIYSYHNKLIYVNLEQQTKERILTDNTKNKDIFDLLGDDFKRQDALDFCEKLKCSSKTIDRLLKKWKDNNIIYKVDKFSYKKIKI